MKNNEHNFPMTEKQQGLLMYKPTKGKVKFLRHDTQVVNSAGLLDGRKLIQGLPAYVVLTISLPRRLSWGFVTRSSPTREKRVMKPLRESAWEHRGQTSARHAS